MEPHSKRHKPIHQTEEFCFTEDYKRCYVFPNFKQPREVAHCSVNGPHASKTAETNRCIGRPPTKRRTLATKTTLHKKVISVPKELSRVNFDLNIGFGDQVPKEDKDEHLDILLQCIRQHRIEPKDIVCYRGLLTKIAAVPYEGGRFDDGWIISAQKKGTSVYLCEFKTPSAIEKSASTTQRQELMSYWGHKFETFVTKSSEGTGLATKPSLDLNEEFVSIVKGQIGETTLLFAGEIDCHHQDDSSKYIELKTTRQIDHSGQDRSFKKFKLLKWWLQSFLIGIEDILCGYRDDDGIVHTLEWYKVSKIPRMSAEHWQPSVCFQYLDKFLQFVREIVTDSDRIYTFTRRPGKTNVVVDKKAPDTFEFLPEWFV